MEATEGREKSAGEPQNLLSGEALGTQKGAEEDPRRRRGPSERPTSLGLEGGSLTLPVTVPTVFSDR